VSGLSSGCSTVAVKGPRHATRPSSFSRKIRPLQEFCEWAMLDLNQRPPPCKGDERGCTELHGVAKTACTKGIALRATLCNVWLCALGDVEVM
jgi:hypothetical protein